VSKVAQKKIQAMKYLIFFLTASAQRKTKSPAKILFQTLFKLNQGNCFSSVTLKDKLSGI
jgi:hypothetical protein